jgi:hypothetical protein
MWKLIHERYYKKETFDIDPWQENGSLRAFSGKGVG